jgi:hypothetical protein
MTIYTSTQALNPFSKRAIVMAPYISTAHKLFFKSKPTAHRPYSAAALIFDVAVQHPSESGLSADGPE